ncbi:hydroxypyruvate isomerase [Litorimonas cladophorae]|uniref:Hydroxypyruvate isomerase n=1 Tax=Litorimonas cladophorae TaxID=1220491 RepID=A0A918KL40_9PROT|nr:TIM barrel protein [Litorimonas cladophorae]GGX65039.1 hydroxypyruvate isomerase [Litorimonas cladophorae]
MDRRQVFSQTLALGAGAAALTACVAPQSEILTESQRRSLLSGFALNVESWYTDLPFEARFDKAAEDNFSHVEFWFVDSWDRKASDLAKLARDAGVKVAQIVGDSPALANPDSRAEFIDNCKRAVENARILDTKIVTLTGHQNVEGLSKSESLKAYAAHMAAVAPIFEDAKIFAAIEPFNPYDHPGHFIYGSADAVEIVNTLQSPFVKLNWDLFHMQRHEGELIGNLKRHADTICYVQIADTPDRGQPGTGDVNYVNVLKQVRSGGYSGPIGLELWAKDKNFDQAIADVLSMQAQMTDLT